MMRTLDENYLHRGLGSQIKLVGCNKAVTGELKCNPWRIGENNLEFIDKMFPLSYEMEGPPFVLKEIRTTSPIR